MPRLLPTYALPVLLLCAACSTQPADAPAAKAAPPNPANFKITRLEGKNISFPDSLFTLSAKDYDRAVAQCARLKVGMPLPEVEKVTGPLRKQLEGQAFFEQLLAASNMSKDRSASSRPSATNMLIDMTFSRTKTGEYILESFKPLPTEKN